MGQDGGRGWELDLDCTQSDSSDELIDRHLNGQSWVVVNPRQNIIGTVLKDASTFIYALAGQLICACGRIQDQPELKCFLFVSSFL